MVKEREMIQLLVLYPSELTEAEEKNRHVIHYFIHLWTRTNGPLGRHCKGQPPCVPAVQVQVPWIIVRVEKGILSPHERLLHLINLIFRSFNPQLWSSCAKPDRLSGGLTITSTWIRVG